jgi:Xaa-Pro aminopeptidase
MFDYAERRRRLYEKMAELGVDLVFLPKHSADLEYLTGSERRVPTFGNVAYTHHWVAGAFFSPKFDPLFLLPRMIGEFDSPNGIESNTIIISEKDDAVSIFLKTAKKLGKVSTIAIGSRTWGETVIQIMNAFPDAQIVNAEPLINPLRRIKSSEELATMTKACAIVDEVMTEIQDKVRTGVTELDLAAEVALLMRKKGSRTESFDTAVWSMGPLDKRDATVRVSQQPLRSGMGVSFDFGSVVDGYCSDFGRTIHIGEPGKEYIKVYDLVMAAQAAGIATVKPGVTAAEVHNACREVIVDGGYGDWFRHRTGHCIGLDVHEFPFISEEDMTPLEVGMTFTIEPSVFWPGQVGVRVEDIIVCEANGGRKLNQHSTHMVVN